MKKKIKHAKSIRDHLYFCLSVFGAHNKWEKYLECAMLIHDFEALIKKLEKKK
jgi:hypothetical protein